MMFCNNSDKPSRRWFSRLTAGNYLKVLLTAALVAVICMAIFLSLGKIRLSQAVVHMALVLVYSVSISLPSMLLLNWIAFRYTERFPRLVFLFCAAALLVSSCFGVLVSNLLFLIAGIIPSNTFWLEFQANITFSIVIALVVGLSITTYETLRYKLQAATLELRTRQVEQERAYKLLAEARLSSLESRIHPHFLFNTLNSISALIPRDPQLAEDTVGKLASLLRFSLGANHSSLVSLSQELKIVRDYLEIEKTRFGKRLSYSIEVPEELQDVKVPPLALQSLVENAVKHVVSQRSQGAVIEISGSRDAGRVRLKVLDDGPGFSLDAIKPEHGLGNLIARLELLFGSEGRLDVTRENEKTAVSLSFPWNGRS
jgi:sensor histidine kinase YesM